MSHYAHIVANRILAQIHAFLVCFVQTFTQTFRILTQIWRGYLDKKLVADLNSKDLAQDNFLIITWLDNKLTVQ